MLTWVVELASGKQPWAIYLLLVKLYLFERWRETNLHLSQTLILQLQHAYFRQSSNCLSLAFTALIHACLYFSCISSSFSCWDTISSCNCLCLSHAFSFSLCVSARMLLNSFCRFARLFPRTSAEFWHLKEKAPLWKTVTLNHNTRHKSNTAQFRSASLKHSMEMNSGAVLSRLQCQCYSALSLFPFFVARDRGGKEKFFISSSETREECVIEPSAIEVPELRQCSLKHKEGAKGHVWTALHHNTKDAADVPHCSHLWSKNMCINLKLFLFYSLNLSCSCPKLLLELIYTSQDFLRVHQVTHCMA